MPKLAAIVKIHPDYVMLPYVNTHGRATMRTVRKADLECGHTGYIAPKPLRMNSMLRDDPKRSDCRCRVSDEQCRYRQDRGR